MLKNLENQILLSRKILLKNQQQNHFKNITLLISNVLNSFNLHLFNYYYYCRYLFLLVNQLNSKSEKSKKKYIAKINLILGDLIKVHFLMVYKVAKLL